MVLVLMNQYFCGSLVTRKEVPGSSFFLIFGGIQNNDKWMYEIGKYQHYLCMAKVVGNLTLNGLNIRQLIILVRSYTGEW